LGNSNKLILVYRNMPQQQLSESVNIMLTPQFYSLKKEVLPLKYAFQAKKIAPSLFDGYLTDLEAYTYFVYKEGEKWVFIAYYEEEISKFLVSKGIQPEQVDKIFFAEQASEHITHPVALGEKNALLVLDGTVVTIPQNALNESAQSDTVLEAFTPKSGVTFQSSFHSYLTQKQALWISGIFLIFAVMYFVEGWRYAKSAALLQTEISALLEEYPSLQSEYTRKNIAKKYRTIDKNEHRKRDVVKSLAGLIFKGVKVDAFKMDEVQFSVRFKCADPKVAKRLKELAKREGFSGVKSLTGNIVAIEENL